MKASLILAGVVLSLGSVTVIADDNKTSEDVIMCKITSLKDSSIQADLKIPFNQCKGLDEFHSIGRQGLEERQKNEILKKKNECKEISSFNLSAKLKCKKEIDSLKNSQEQAVSRYETYSTKICHYEQKIYTQSAEGNILYLGVSYKLVRVVPYVVIANDFTHGRIISGDLILPSTSKRLVLSGHINRPLLISNEYIENASEELNADVLVNCEKVL